MKKQKNKHNVNKVDFALIPLAILYVAAFLKIFLSFKIISAYTFLIILSVASILISAVIIFLLYRKTKLYKTLATLYYNRITECTLGYICSGVFFVSITPENTFTIDDLKDIISLQWNILGISITIFLVWSVVALNQLEKLEAKDYGKPNNLVEKVIFISTKKIHNMEVFLKYYPVKLLKINTFILFATTTLVYLTPLEHKANLLNQNIAIFSFIICTNTLTSMILEILEPFYKKRLLKLDDTKITKSDIEQEELLEQAKQELAMISNFQYIDEDRKGEIKQNILDKILK